VKLLERLKAKQAKLLEYVSKKDLYGGIVDSLDPSAGDDQTQTGVLSFDVPHSTGLMFSDHESAAHLAKLLDQGSVLDAIKAKVDKDILSGSSSYTAAAPAGHSKIQTTNQKMVDVLGLPANTYDFAVDFSLDKAPSCTCSFYLTEAQLQVITGSTAIKVVEHGPTYPYKPFKIV